jgi:hypothetical protein
VKINNLRFVLVVLAGGLLAGCGGMDESAALGAEQEGTPAAVVEETTAPPAQDAKDDREVSAFSFWAWQCGANTVSLRDYQGGPAVAQIYYGWDVRVDHRDGGWWWVYSPNYNRSGWVLGSYFCY